MGIEDLSWDELGNNVSRAFAEHLKFQKHGFDNGFENVELNRSYAIISLGLESYNRLSESGPKEFRSFYCPKNKNFNKVFESDLEKLGGGNSPTILNKEYFNNN